MAKLLKLRRGTTSQHNTFTGAEGEVTIDTTKDTAVVHDGAQAGGRPLAREDMSNVSSASIASRLGADAIAVTKIAGGTLPSDVKITDANVSGNLTIANADINADAVNGSKIADDSINSEHYVDGSIDRVHLANDIVDTTKLINFPTNTILGRETAGTGNATTLSAAQVRSIINVENGATADQTAAEIRAKVESATDSNVFTDADHSKLNGIESGATGDQTAAEILTAIKTVDGSGSGLDADTLDGAQPSASAGNGTIVQRNSSGYIFANYFNTTANDVSSGVTKIMCETGNDNYIRHADAGAVRSFINVENGATADQSASEILTAIKTVDGGGSGLDADTVDGIQSSSFVRSDAADTASGDITFTGGAGAVTIAANSDIRIASGSWSGDTAGKIQHHANHMYFQNGGGQWIFRRNNGTEVLYIDASGNLVADGNVTAYSDARLKTDISTINDALGICGKLRGVSYKWLKNNEPGIGVIAQEVEQVIPEVVLTNKTTDPETGEEKEVKSVDYGKIVGVLINAINELKEEVEELKNAKITG